MRPTLFHAPLYALVLFAVAASVALAWASVRGRPDDELKRRLGAALRDSLLIGAAALVAGRFIWGSIAESLAVRSFGVLLAAGSLVALVGQLHEARRDGMATGPFLKATVAGWVVGVFGSRLAAYIELYDVYYRDASVLEFFRFDRGGLTWYGGALLGCPVVAILIGRYGYRVLRAGDLYMPWLLLGHAFGRLGCFLNGCCWGVPAGPGWDRPPFAFSFPIDSAAWIGRLRAAGIADIAGDIEAFLPIVPKALRGGTEPLVAVQLFEAASGVAIAAALYAAYRLRRREGQVLALALVLYPLSRFLLEGYRADNAQYAAMTISQWVGVAILPLGAASLIWASLRGRPAEPPPAYGREQATPP